MSHKHTDSWVRIIDVSDPVLHPKGYTLYKVSSKVFPKNSVEAVTEVVVWKRYNDFKKLHKALNTIHQNLYLKGTFPPFAKTRFFGRFDPAVIEERRLSALQLLQFAASLFPLFTSQIFVKFFEEGHIVESSQQLTNELELPVDDVLQPEISLLPSNANDSNSTNVNSASTQEEQNKESTTSLGGIWQHHQVPDNISLNSQCTDDDDRTTFTDDDSILSRPSLDITEFDPLLCSENLDKSIPNNLNTCNSWLLSALECCTDTPVDKDSERILEYPTPFGEFDFPEDSPTPNIERTPESISKSTNQSHFTFDLPEPPTEEPDLISEFDPLNNNEQQNVQEDAFVCDEFAMTPNAYKNESSERPSYIVLASKYVDSARESEEVKNYMEAFESYKKAIEVLLQGIQKDKCSDLKDAVRKKVLLYLMRAEELYENKLPKSDTRNLPKVDLTVPSLSRIKNVDENVEELNKYKVIGILDKTLLVLDISNNETYVAKALCKTSSEGIQHRAHIVPQDVPFMVKLHHVYETCYAVFLILEHATGGRLWNYVSSFIQRRPLSPIEDCTCIQVESKTTAELSNIYSGKKISENANSGSSHLVINQDSDLTPSENCPSSYIALFKKYADSINKEELVSLAKYNKAINTSNKSFNTENKEPQQTSHKNARNRLSSSTGSLDTFLSQKTCVMEAFNAMDEAILQATSKSLLPEPCIMLWTAEIVIAFEHLHNLGIIWMDFHPNNILLGAEGHILLTYQSNWNNNDFLSSGNMKCNLFCAPEVGSIFPVTSDCDWWSLGAILFELLTGQSLVNCHPTGITRHTSLNFPTDISSDAKDLITKLLQYNPTERLGSGIYGIEEIKSHPFFHSIDWKTLCPK